MKRQTSPEEWNRIKDVLLNDRLIEPFIEKVRRDYPELEGREDDFVEEVLTQFSGRHGAEKLRKMAQEIKEELGGDATAETIAETAVRRVKSLLNDFWKGVCDLMGWQYTSAEDIADAVLRDMLNGVNPIERMKAAKVAKQKYAPDGKPKILDYDNYGKKFKYSISGNAIDESLNPKQQGKSVNKGVHLALVEHLDDVIGKSIEVEEHPDYPKNEKGERDGSIVNPNALMHRFYGAIEFEGKTYRVMTLMREYKSPSNSDGPYAYEVQKIEVPNEETSSTANGVGSNKPEGVSYPLAKLLNNVEKSKDSGKYLLDESKKTQENENNSLKFQKVENDTHSDNFKNFFGDWEKDPENASKIVDREGEPMVVYHQTANDFTVFDPRHKGAGANDYQLPFGIFMKPSARDIGVGGKKQMALYANIRRPLRVENRQALSRLLQSNVEGYREALAEYEKIDREYSKKFDEAMKFDHDRDVENWNKWKAGEMTEEEYQNAVSDTAEDVINQWREAQGKPVSEMKELLDNYFRNSEYDGKQRAERISKELP